MTGRGRVESRAVVWLNEECVVTGRGRVESRAVV